MSTKAAAASVKRPPIHRFGSAPLVLLPGWEWADEVAGKREAIRDQFAGQAVVLIEGSPSDDTEDEDLHVGVFKFVGKPVSKAGWFMEGDGLAAAICAELLSMGVDFSCRCITVEGCRQWFKFTLEAKDSAKARPTTAHDLLGAAVR